MQPEVVAAIERLEREGLLADPPVSHLRRIARRELVSVRAELRLLLYLGVAAAGTGAALLVKEHYRQIGPAAIAVFLGLGAAACFVHVARRAPPFSWGEVEPPSLAFEYILLLGALLVGSDLAYLESQFELLAASWPHHLLLVALLYLAAAYRFDSAKVLVLALTSLAAWLGVSTRFWDLVPLDRQIAAVRWNAIACGALYTSLGAAAAAFEKKAHFEPVWVNLGLVLLFAGLLSGIGEPTWLAWDLILLVAAAAVLRISYTARRPIYFAVGLFAADIGLLRLLWEVAPPVLFPFLVAITSLAVVAVVVKVQRGMKERP